LSAKIFADNFLFAENFCRSFFNFKNRSARPKSQTLEIAPEKSAKIFYGRFICGHFADKIRKFQKNPQV